MFDSSIWREVFFMTKRARMNRVYTWVRHSKSCSSEKNMFFKWYMYYYCFIKSIMCRYITYKGRRMSPGSLSFPVTHEDTVHNLAAEYTTCWHLHTGLENVIIASSCLSRVWWINLQVATIINAFTSTLCLCWMCETIGNDCTVQDEGAERETCLTDLNREHLLCVIFA